MRIAIIGAGNVGGALGEAWAGIGHRVIFGVRDPRHAKHAVLRSRPATTVLAVAEAAKGADVVVLALPWSTAESAVKGLGDLAGKIVIDCMNPLVMRDGILGLDRGFTTSGGETVAGWLPGARIVKTLNQVGAEIMADARRFPARPAMFMAGDDPHAKATVAGLLSDLGVEPFDAGALRQARLLEPLAMVWINQALFGGKGRHWALTALTAE